MMEAMTDRYQIGGQELAVPRSELWIMSYYRVSEIAGAMLFGKVARRIKDETLRVLISRHFADEARHAWVWTDAIVKVGGIPLEIPNTYQSRYGAEVGLPTSELELLGITQIFERRVIEQYRKHQRRRGTHPVVQEALQSIMVDEQWHLKWVKDQLKALEKKHGKKEVADTVERYRAVDERVYAEIQPYENEPWKIFGQENP
jgi:bacterioferritin (cytochrome b1)